MTESSKPTKQQPKCPVEPHPISAARPSGHALRAKGPQALRDALEPYLPQLRQIYGAAESPEGLVMQAWHLYQLSPALQECEPSSFVRELVRAAQLRLALDPILGQAYFVPAKGQCQLRIGYQGYITMALRSGQVLRIEAQVVHEKDHFEFELGLNPKLRHVPSLDSNPGEIVAAYAIAWLANGQTAFWVSSRKEIEAAKSRSPAPTGPWKTDEEAMARKTAVRRLVKWLPLSIEDQRAIQREELLEADVVPPEVLDQWEQPVPPAPTQTKLQQVMQYVQEAKERMQAATAANPESLLSVPPQSAPQRGNRDAVSDETPDIPF